MRGREYAGEIRHIFAEITTATERHREHAEATHLKLVAVEVVAEKWLMPRLTDFKAAHPDISIEFETDHREVDPDRRDFDVWIAFTDRVAETLHVETLFEETLIPVCSPALLKVRGQPREPADLHGWPLLYDLHWTTYRSHWFAHHGAREANLSQASGFRRSSPGAGSPPRRSSPAHVRSRAEAGAADRRQEPYHAPRLRRLAERATRDPKTCTRRLWTTGTHCPLKLTRFRAQGWSFLLLQALSARGRSPDGPPPRGWSRSTIGPMQHAQRGASPKTSSGPIDQFRGSWAAPTRRSSTLRATTMPWSWPGTPRSGSRRDVRQGRHAGGCIRHRAHGRQVAFGAEAAAAGRAPRSRCDMPRMRATVGVRFTLAVASPSIMAWWFPRCSAAPWYGARGRFFLPAAEGPAA